jgi:serine/threonine protein kinase
VATRVGESFGKYEIVRLLGKGGMGDVYEALDTTKNRTVALKILTDQYSQDERFRERFQRESRAAAILAEPHVIPIHDWGEVDDHLYIDMRLVEGQTLHDMLRAGPIEPEQATSIIGQIASALDAAHAAGLIHRDVKPQNIMVTPDDFTYLVDFGIAETKGDSRLTMTGTQVGSMAYMAPERFGDEQAAPAVDVYSLACVLYEALTGSTPFPTDSLEQIMGAHISAPPPRPSVMNPRVPIALDEVTVRGMAKQPDDRYGSAGALGRSGAGVAGGPWTATVCGDAARRLCLSGRGSAGRPRHPDGTDCSRRCHLRWAARALGRADRHRSRRRTAARCDRHRHRHAGGTRQHVGGYIYRGPRLRPAANLCPPVEFDVVSTAAAGFAGDGDSHSTPCHCHQSGYTARPDPGTISAFQ